jgi:hypothetical protein
VREFLDRYAGADSSGAALHEFLASASASRSGSGATGRAWKRADLYERRPRA